LYIDLVSCSIGSAPTEGADTSHSACAIAIDCFKAETESQTCRGPFRAEVRRK
jgi:hypothetical protein